DETGNAGGEQGDAIVAAAGVEGDGFNGGEVENAEIVFIEGGGSERVIVAGKVGLIVNSNGVGTDTAVDGESNQAKGQKTGGRFADENRIVSAVAEEI